MYPHLIDRDIKTYEEYCPEDVKELFSIAQKLKKIKICHINSTSHGGGVSEILYSEIPLLRSLGLTVDWQVMRGTNRFFPVTKKIHNGMQGEDIKLTNREKSVYKSVIESNIEDLCFDYDVIFIHDFHPMAMPYFGGKQDSAWIWRCHVDTSTPNPGMVKFLEKFKSKYDAEIYSSPQFTQSESSNIIFPAIDAFSIKNRKISRQASRMIARDLGVNPGILLVQVSRFDKWKGFDRSIELFRRLKIEFKNNLDLVLLGSFADDDPEGLNEYNKVIDEVAGEDNILVMADRDKLIVNVFQSAADIVIQPSIREGFGLTVTEALWKETFVIGSAVGGIMLQLPEQYLAFDGDDFFDKIKILLGMGTRLNSEGKEFVKNLLLLPRMMLEELKLVYRMVK